jgi:hypothetical protein
VNTKLLRRVAKHIAEEPRRLVMAQWVVLKKDYRSEKIYDWGEFSHKFPPCNTTGCIAGWTVLLKEKVESSSFAVSDSQRIAKRAEALLGLDENQSYRLFGGWPQEFQRPYEMARSAAKRAKIAVARIEHFIKTKGQE